MANGLFPVFDVPATVAEETDIETEYSPAPMWSMEAGDFVTDGAGKALYGSGYDAWVLWCTKSILTQRWAHYGYSDNEGIEAEESFQQPDIQAVASSFERTITQAHRADQMGRTSQVRDFEFTWEADGLWITCTAIGTNGDTATIQAKLNK